MTPVPNPTELDIQSPDALYLQFCVLSATCYEKKNVHVIQIPDMPYCIKASLAITYILWPVASFTKEVNPRLAKCPLVFNGRLANRGLTCLAKEATGVTTVINTSNMPLSRR